MPRLTPPLSASIAFAALVLVLPNLGVEAAGSDSGLVTSRDGRRVYVSKDIGTERWTITRDTGTGRVTGLVFFSDGRDPLFVECDQERDDGALIDFACHGAAKCVGSVCSGDQWSFIANVSLPSSFFQAGR